MVFLVFHFFCLEWFFLYIGRPNIRIIHKIKENGDIWKFDLLFSYEFSSHKFQCTKSNLFYEIFYIYHIIGPKGVAGDQGRPGGIGPQGLPGLFFACLLVCENFLLQLYTLDVSSVDSILTFFTMYIIFWIQTKYFWWFFRCWWSKGWNGRWWYVFLKWFCF